MSRGFTITKKGRNYLAKLVAGDTLSVTKVMVGAGRLPDDVDPELVDELIAPKAMATSTVPMTRDSIVEFLIEYRNDMNGGLKEAFDLNEYGVFARDKEQGEILLYYGNLGDHPEHVDAYVHNFITIRRYPVSIVLSKELKVVLEFNAAALVTWEEFQAHIYNRHAHPVIDCGYFTDRRPTLPDHMTDPLAHRTMIVDGNATGISTADSMEEHVRDRRAHQNIIIDGNH